MTEEKLVEAIINAYHTTRTRVEFTQHILSKPTVQRAFAEYRRPANAPRLRELAALAAVLLRNHCADVDVVYDGVTCDGTCLADDIESELADG